MLTPDQITQARSSLGLGNASQPQSQPPETWDSINQTLQKITPSTGSDQVSAGIGSAVNAVGGAMENAGTNVEKSFTDLPGKIGEDVTPAVTSKTFNPGEDAKAGFRVVGDTLESLFSPFTAAPAEAMKDTGATDAITKAAQVLTSPLSSSKSFQQFSLSHPNAEQDIGRAVTIALTGLGGATPEKAPIPEEGTATEGAGGPPTGEVPKETEPTSAMPDLTGKNVKTSPTDVQGQLETAWKKVLPDRYYNSGDENLFKGDVKALANEGVAPSVWENGDRLNVKPSVDDLNTKIGAQHDLADQILQEHGGQHNILDERNQMIQKVDEQVKAGYVNPKAATAMKSYISDQMNGLLASENKISPSEVKQYLGEETNASGINLNDLNPEQLAKAKVINGEEGSSVAGGGLKTQVDSKTFNDFKRSLNDDAESAYHKDPNADVRNSAKAAALMQDHIGESIKGASSMPEEIDAINAAQSRLLRIKGMLNRMGEDLTPSEFNSAKKLLGRMLGRGAGMLGGSAIGHPFLGSAPGGELGAQLFSRLGSNIFDRMGEYSSQLKNLGITPESMKAIERAQQAVETKAPVAPTQ